MSVAAHKSTVSMLSLALPLAVLSVLGVGLAVKVGMLDFSSGVPAVAMPETVRIEPRRMQYRAEGHFIKNGYAVDAPLLDVSLARPFEVMKYQVTRADYARCAADGVCPPAEPVKAEGRDIPVTGVNYTDALSYAEWLSDKTGAVWQLPTDQQWAFAAGKRFPDDALGIDAASSNPALRWLADYERESSRKSSADPEPQALGAFGENEYGVADIGGNVWEWTQTCHRRVHVDDRGRVINEAPACGIFVVEGKHRASMSFFIRDPKSGGCAVGVPPDNLGFRLVRDDRWYAPLLRAVRNRLGPAV